MRHIKLVDFLTNRIIYLPDFNDYEIGQQPKYLIKVKDKLVLSQGSIIELDIPRVSRTKGVYLSMDTEFVETTEGMLICIDTEHYSVGDKFHYILRKDGFIVYTTKVAKIYNLIHVTNLNLNVTENVEALHTTS